MSTFDWKRCIFCQKEIPKVRTVCPADSKWSDVGCGYATLSGVVRGFTEVSHTVPGLKTDVWDDGDGIEATCQKNRACWHAPCRQKLHVTKLNRLRTQTQPEFVAGTCSAVASSPDSGHEVDEQIPQKRVKRNTVVSTQSTCFFCDETEDDLRQVMTFQLDERVRQCASIVNDCILSGKLAGGDDCLRGQISPKMPFVFILQSIKSTKAP